MNPWAVCLELLQHEALLYTRRARSPPIKHSDTKNLDAATPHNTTALTASGHTVTRGAQARLPTRYGQFSIVAFTNNKDHKDHVAIIKGDPKNATAFPVRIHSECLTGDVFTSKRCDCREQLESAMDFLSNKPQGAILYMRQEGRGIGLANKIHAYALQEQGLDTVDANKHLGFDDDMRDYEVSAAMLKLLEVTSINLMTNNPRKVNGLKEAGVHIVERMPIQIEPNEHNEHYLRTKRDRSNHMFTHLKK